MEKSKSLLPQYNAVSFPEPQSDNTTHSCTMNQYSMTGKKRGRLSERHKQGLSTKIAFGVSAQLDVYILLHQS